VKTNYIGSSTTIKKDDMVSHLRISILWFRSLINLLPSQFM
jgi:hypothetical protein